MKIAILGTRGIPNYYGGFEQFAQYLSVGLVKNNHEVFVYNSSNHPYQESEYRGVKIIHCYDPEDRIGTVGQFVYDFNCILDSRKRNFDIILQLGYTSSSIFNFLFKNSRIVTNMDGLEWKRSKYSKPVQIFLKYAEKLAVSYSDILIADSKGIKEYLDSKYNLNSKFIPYGADANQQFDLAHLNKFSLEPYRYDMLIARLEPENSVKEIIEGFAASTTSRNLVIVGSTSTNLGQYLKNNIKDKRLLYLEYISDINQLNSLRYYSNLYFHGHTVGGTNPSLLEAMASQALVCANDNVFNRSILSDDAHYFTSSKNVSKLVNSLNKDEYSKFVTSNRNKIIETYNWESIIKQYEKVLDET
jgi:glycosyltransferase involved in cell wall biosynthesis